MNVHSASRSKSLQCLLRALREGAGQRHAVDSTLLLVLHLLDEKFGPDRLKSRWLPYLEMLPSVDTLSTFSPLFFDEHTHMRLLQSTDLHPHMLNYHALLHARKRVIMEMLEEFKFKTWTPELCVDPSLESSVVRFVNVAFITESPLLALKLQDSDDQQRRTLATLKTEAIAAALHVVEVRLKALNAGLGTSGGEDGADGDKAIDIPTLMIRKYMMQQQSHTLALQAALQTRTK
ncbi:hypothetical protein FI667_g9643, partial [Globisporangium splendens]